jgi:para-aminobenzoate synthetase component 1
MASRQAAGPEDVGALAPLLAERPAPVLLESSAFDPRWGRYSIAACRPVRTLTLRDDRLIDSQGRDITGGNLLASLRQALGIAGSGGRISGHTGIEDGTPYGPGWIGFVGYEFGRQLERLPGQAVRDTGLPDLHLALYSAVAVFDHLLRQWSILWLTDDDLPSGAQAAEELERMLYDAAAKGRPQPEPANPSTTAQPMTSFISNFRPDQYRQAVQRCIDYIAAGDIFQVNLSQRLKVPDAPPPLAIYQALRRRNPAWHAAMLLLEDWAILSSSPELFLRLRGGHVLTRPIKGTRPRLGQAVADLAAKAELLKSPKDNAELAMIIDLLRNDLGRVCRFGTVRVSHSRTLEEHPTVYHLVGTVQGQLRPECDAVDLLAATFPGGSITGAPKIRAMQIIDELEPVARGPYTGCIGWIGFNGDMELNIAIRGVVWQAGAAYVQVGGGIVADSTPEGEYAETLDKARAVLEAIWAAQAR